MEATKKKKAYLKPEMSRFEVKTQEFIAGSKYKEEEDYTREQFEAIPPCLIGNASSWIPSMNYKEGDCFTVNGSALGNHCLDAVPDFSLIPGEIYQIIKIDYVPGTENDKTPKPEMVYVQLASKTTMPCTSPK